METEFLSLFFITIGAFICPVIASIIPNKLIPETVFLLVVGMLIGPNVFDIAQTSGAIDLLSDLGLGFLFLLAGYEIEPKELSGKGGKAGFITWIVTFVIALAIAIPVSLQKQNLMGGFAIAIILTTTAFGTIVPILKDKGLTDTPLGKAVVEYGVWGELCPIIAIALILTTRATWVTMLLLAIFVVVAVGAALFARHLGRKGTKVENLIQANSETNAQMSLRFVVMLLVGLVALSAVFNLDIVLGAFAAGFVLRVIIPQGDMRLEHKLNGIAYGFFVPLFFIVSGMQINPHSVIEEPHLLIIFIVSLLLIRAVPIFVSLSIRKDTKQEDPRMRASVAFYCTTALPLIVAATSVATSAGAMTPEMGSVLIASGGITVLVMPLLASITMHTIDADLNIAAKEIAHHSKEALSILKQHRRLERERNSVRSLQHKEEKAQRKMKAKRRS